MWSLCKLSCRAFLPDLTTKIILIVAQYLSPSSLISLSYSYRIIRNKMGVSIESSLSKKNRIGQLSEVALENNLPTTVFPKEGCITWSLPTIKQDMYHSERLKLLYMLDRDQKIPKYKAVCSGCADTHDRSLFSSDYGAQSNHIRRCLGKTERIWICPHCTFDHKSISTSVEP